MQTVADLPIIHDLIRASYLAMLDHYPEPPGAPSKIAAWAEAAVKKMTPDAFAAEFLTGADSASQFWVAEAAPGGVVGCVGLKRVAGHRDEAELVNMAVSPVLRGGGVGRRLVAHLVAFCEGPGAALRVTLTTANPSAASFYLRYCGFVAAREQVMPAVTAGAAEVRLLYAVRYLGERIIRRVAVVGGTHGNERLGVELVEQWTADPSPLSRPTLEVRQRVAHMKKGGACGLCDVLVLPPCQVFAWPGNPEAIARNVRFVDADLNRQFAVAEGPASDDGKGAAEGAPLEASRAAAIRALVASHSIDFVIDLHSTNADVGLVVMVPAAEKNVAAMRVAHALATKPGRPPVHITGTDLPLLRNWSVDAAAPAGLSIEVGPLPHGTLSAGLLEATRRLVMDALDAIDSRNQALVEAAAASAAGAAVPPSGLLAKEGIVSAASAAALVCVACPRPVAELFVHVASVPYPPSPPGGARWLVHPSLEGPNWRPIADGDVAFISASGSGETLPFAAPREQGWGAQAGAPATGLHTLFVNEAAYQASGTAFAVYRKEERVVL